MKRTWEVGDMIGRLQTDPWRLNDRPFSEDVGKCHEILFNPTRTRREKVEALASWLAE